jgi:hypothetical protein
MEVFVALSSEDLNDCWSKAQAIIKGSVEPALDKVFEKEVANNLKLMIAGLPFEVMEVFRMQNPKEFEQMSKFMGG